LRGSRGWVYRIVLHAIDRCRLVGVRCAAGLVGARHTLRVRFAVPCPYNARCRTGFFDDQNPMHMVGHDDECIQRHIGKMGGDGLPARLGDLPRPVEQHAPGAQLAEKELMPVGGEGDEVSAGLGVVIALEADGLAVVLRRGGHGGRRCAVKSTRTVRDRRERDFLMFLGILSIFFFFT